MSIHKHPSPYAGGLSEGFAFLKELVKRRLAHHLDESVGFEFPEWLPPPYDSTFGRLVRDSALTSLESVVLLLAAAPQLAPGLLDEAIRAGGGTENQLISFGGIRGQSYRGIIPTGQTALFLLTGTDIQHHLRVSTLLHPAAPLRKNGFLDLLPPPPGEPPLAGHLRLSPEWAERLIWGTLSIPTFSPAFPAQLLETNLTWDDLVLPERSLQEIAYLKNYLDHHERLAGDPVYGRHSRRGYRALFHGPPGTGKTLTATLLGKAVDKPVFRVDLSMVVSKWIGETEKNLSGLFDRAESKGWILFFDEADALFSKRGEVKESRDKYANQETSFLLQRVENYDGLCILATNFRQNLDKAFTRRFESIVAFTPPTTAERLALWHKMLPESHPLAEGVDLRAIAATYEVSGASIANAIRHAVYEAVAARELELTTHRLQSAIRREYEKEDRMFPAD
ncbi:ATPase family protein associated with various cellular activities (AAA) [Neolewinella xylanilytica]|uniref:ATPase family protein associated with various cellular activities (AAA) n=1 Tax=Neolewinella xylanilytica TaxID=1514080 RepID=A0A2S6I8V2_9BACT|nr:ATP-binding protein [Neolewinella xylanilytica]PPK87912.1 ATPase family protein associated with various cellular activities (AAA) [Neolewinella xylanilytica]